MSRSFPRDTFDLKDGNVMDLRSTYITIGDEKISKIKTYTISKKIGRGSFATVYKARHKPTNCNVALKIMRPPKNKAKAKKNEERVKFEAEILMRFNHPHIIKCFETIDYHGIMIVVLEYVRSKDDKSDCTLLDYIVDHFYEDNCMEPNKARKIFQQLISALDYCHSNRSVHRDLKPENILICHSTEQVKLVDFGLGNYIDQGEFLESFVGSPNYAAPEIIKQEKYSSSVDIWSLGCVLFALLNGRLCFDDKKTRVLFDLIERGVYEEKTEYMDDEVSDLIRRMLTVDPVQRITISQIREHPWFKKGYIRPYLKKRFELGCSHRDVKISSIVFPEACRLMRIPPTFEYRYKNMLMSDVKNKPTPFVVTYNITFRFMLRQRNSEYLALRKRYESEGKDADDEMMKRESERRKRREKLEFAELGGSLTGPKMDWGKNSCIPFREIKGDAGWRIGIDVETKELSIVELFDVIYTSMKRCGMKWARDEGRKGCSLIWRYDIWKSSNACNAPKSEMVEEEGEEEESEKNFVVGLLNVMKCDRVLVPQCYKIAIQFVRGNFLYFFHRQVHLLRGMIRQELKNLQKKPKEKILNISTSETPSLEKTKVRMKRRRQSDIPNLRISKIKKKAKRRRRKSHIPTRGSISCGGGARGAISPFGPGPVSTSPIGVHSQIISIQKHVRANSFHAPNPVKIPTKKRSNSNLEVRGKGNAQEPEKEPLDHKYPVRKRKISITIPKNRRRLGRSRRLSRIKAEIESSRGNVSPISPNSPDSTSPSNRHSPHSPTLPLPRISGLSMRGLFGGSGFNHLRAPVRGLRSGELTPPDSFPSQNKHSKTTLSPIDERMTRKGRKRRKSSYLDYIYMMNVRKRNFSLGSKGKKST